MPVLEINGLGKFEVDASFDKLSPEQQNAFVANMVKEATAGKKSSMGGAPVSQGEDIAKGAAAGLAKGAMSAGGMIGDMRDLASSAVGWGAGKLGASPETAKTIESVVGMAQRLNPITAFAPTTKQVTEAANPVTGELYQPQTTAGKFASSAAEFVPGSLLMPGGMARNLASGVSAGLGSEAAGQLTDGSSIEPVARLGGAVAGGLVPGALGKAAGAFNRAPSVPSQEQLKAAGQSAYAEARDAGVIINQQGMGRLQQNIEKTLADFAYAPELQPKVPALLNAMKRNEGQNVTLEGLETLRKTASTIGGSIDRSERALGRKLVGEIDDFMAGLKPADTLAGDAEAATKALTEARRLWQMQAKSGQINEAVQKAQNRTASTGSGGNIDNATRQELRKVLERGRNWTPDEKAALEKAIYGTPTQNALRLAGKLSPSGNGLMAALGIGATAINPMMAIPMGLGMGAKYAADKMTRSNVATADKIVRAGGLLSATQSQPNAIQRLGLLGLPEQKLLANALFAGTGLRQ